MHRRAFRTLSAHTVRVFAVIVVTVVATGLGGPHRLALSQSDPRTAVIETASVSAGREAGFSAVSSTIVGSAPARAGLITYGRHKLRIDQGNRTSAIVDLRSGAFTLLVHPTRKYAQISVEDMKMQRAAARRRTLKHVETLPPKTQNTVRAQMQAQDEALTAPMKLEATGQTDTLDGTACRTVAWTSPQERGRACVAKSGPVDIQSFRADGRTFRARLRAAGLGTGALALPLLLLAPEGLALRVETHVRLGAAEIRTTTQYRKLRPASFERSHFLPPPDYQRVDIASLTAPGMPRP